MRILLVDDDEGFLNTMDGVLREKGICHHGAGRKKGPEALEGQKIDLIISDVFMRLWTVSGSTVLSGHLQTPGMYRSYSFPGTTTRTCGTWRRNPRTITSCGSPRRSKTYSR